MTRAGRGTGLDKPHFRTVSSDRPHSAAKPATVRPRAAISASNRGRSQAKMGAYFQALTAKIARSSSLAPVTRAKRAPGPMWARLIIRPGVRL